MCLTLTTVKKHTTYNVKRYLINSIDFTRQACEYKEECDKKRTNILGTYNAAQSNTVNCKH